MRPHRSPWVTIGLLGLSLSFLFGAYLLPTLRGAFAYRQNATIGARELQELSADWSIKYLPSARALLEPFSAPTQSDPALPGLPLRMSISTIGVSTSVEYVGLTLEGAMDITQSLETVAWYEPGKRPGEKGSAVIAGHYGLQKGRLAVFDRLNELRKGDLVTIEDDQGRVLTFAVRESRVYDPTDDTSEVFESNDGIAHLNLITCDGVWDAASQRYSHRLVVFTDRIFE